MFLVNIWEENNIVSIPLNNKGTTISGQPTVWLQGDSLFHPVAMAANSKGDLYLSDWVIRQYPNHGSGRIWRISAKEPITPRPNQPTPALINRLSLSETSLASLRDTLLSGDPFSRTIAREILANDAPFDQLLAWLTSHHDALKLEALLTLFNRSETIPISTLKQLLADDHTDLKLITLKYIGTKQRSDLLPILNSALKKGQLAPHLFEAFLETIRNIQPEFVEAYQNVAFTNSKKLPRPLPKDYLWQIIAQDNLPEPTQAAALPFLTNPLAHESALWQILQRAQTNALQMAVLMALRHSDTPTTEKTLIKIAKDEGYATPIRAQSVLHLLTMPGDHCEEIIEFMVDDGLLSYAALSYSHKCQDKAAIEEKLAVIQSSFFNDIWTKRNASNTKPENDIQPWVEAINNEGDPQIGKLVFSAQPSLCLSCHKINGWGGQLGPDLTHVGSSKSKQLLINALLDPSAEIAPEWQGWFVTDKEGRTHYGRQIDVHLNHVKLMNEEGHFDRFDHPEDYGVYDQSLMPAGLHQTMTPREFNHLIAYLASLK